MGEVREFPIPNQIRWWDDRNKVLALAVWLNRSKIFKDTDEVIRFFQKPEKWGSWWYQMQDQIRTTNS